LFCGRKEGRNFEGNAGISAKSKLHCGQTALWAILLKIFVEKINNNKNSLYWTCKRNAIWSFKALHAII